MSLTARLVALERRTPREVLGYRITRTSPRGAVLDDIVMIPDQIVNGRARHVSVAVFTAAYPTGRIVNHTILEDDGREAAPGSLVASWFSEGAR